MRLRIGYGRGHCESEIMRVMAFVACLLTAGCAGALSQRPNNYAASGDARQLASCAYREMREQGELRFRLTPLDDIGGAEVLGYSRICTLHCVEAAYLLATFQSNGAGRTNVAVQEPSGGQTLWRSIVQPAVERCSARLAGQSG